MWVVGWEVGFFKYYGFYISKYGLEWYWNGCDVLCLYIEEVGLFWFL